MRIKQLHAHCLTVHRTPRHMYAQVITPEGGRVIAAASTREADIRHTLEKTGNMDAAAAVGKAIAEKARAAGVDTAAFDRSGFRYHGRVQALADAARANGLQL
jgi:large subunit ribosomal protein L18